MPEEVEKVIRDTWTDEEFLAMDPAYGPDTLHEWVERFARLFRTSIYKWVQAPEAVHLGSLDLDRERALQLPSVQSGEWLK
jgi:NAD+ synthase (glutamine-hydrolysing)